jgi:hypothetical protein
LSHHFFNLKTIKKAFFYLLGVVVVVAASLILSVFLFKDRIIQRFISEANKSLNTPVKIGKIDVSAFTDFPDLAIVLTDVYVEDSHPGNYALLTARQISFKLNPLEIWRGNYSIRGLTITDSETNLKVNAAGKNNFTILKEASPAEGALRFDLRQVHLRNTIVNYRDQLVNQEHQFRSDQLEASIRVIGRLYQIKASGDATTGQIGIRDVKLLVEKNFIVNAHLDYFDDKKEVVIHPSSLQTGGSEFTLQGTYEFKVKNYLNLKAEGKDTDIQTLISLFPESVTTRLKQYRSDGDVFFNLTLEGEISDRKSPMIAIAFGCRNTTLYHPNYKSQIRHANLKGSFASPSLTDFSQAELFLRDVNGELNEKIFNANLWIRNFNDPYVRFHFKGDMDAASVYNFYPIEVLSGLEGFLTTDIDFEGQVSQLKNKSTVQRVKATGAIVMSQVSFGYGKKQTRFSNINGTLQFNNHDLALSNVSGRIENSDFRLNGFFKNIITFLLFENQPIGIETDLKSDYLDLDQLFAFGFGGDDAQRYRFSISPNVQLSFNCNIHRMKYKRFKAARVKGDLLVKNQVAVSRHVTLNAMGGSLTFNGIVDAKNAKAIDVVSSFKLNGIHADSVFYVFENFYQDFIQDKHLKGQAYADVDMEMVLNEELNLIPHTLVANISATIKNGELNNFEPLKKLNKYLDDEGLNQLRFADLKNEIHIENKTIYLPQMEVKSNVTTIQLSGTHTFDQQINYRVVAPLRNKKKIDPDEAFGAIEEDGVGKAKIFLKITGTTDKYEVSLDKDAVKKKIASDLKKEVQELKDAFKLKEQKKKKELALTKEEFDWEN